MSEGHSGEQKTKKSRQRSTLPLSHPSSTIDAKELNFRVRDGFGCGLFAFITGKIVEKIRDLITVNSNIASTRKGVGR